MRCFSGRLGVVRVPMLNGVVGPSFQRSRLHDVLGDTQGFHQPHSAGNHDHTLYRAGAIFIRARGWITRCRGPPLFSSSSLFPPFPPYLPDARHTAVRPLTRKRVRATFDRPAMLGVTTNVKFTRHVSRRKRKRKYARSRKIKRIWSRTKYGVSRMDY